MNCEWCGVLVDTLVWEYDIYQPDLCSKCSHIYGDKIREEREQVSKGDYVPQEEVVKGDYIHSNSIVRAGLGNTNESLGAEFDRFIKRIKAEAWEEGFDAGERDVFLHDELNDWGTKDAKCIPNPYLEGENK